MEACDDLVYVLATLMIFWASLVLWAFVSVWEWRAACKQDMEYAGYLESLLRHVRAFNGDLATHEHGEDR